MLITLTILLIWIAAQTIVAASPVNPQAMCAPHLHTPVKPCKGNTRLHDAVLHAQKEKCKKLLLKHPEQTDDQNNEGMTALHIAVLRNDHVLATLLLTHKANPNIADKSHLTPLHYAFTPARTVLFVLLLEHGASAHRADARGYTALHHAIIAGDLYRCVLLRIHGVPLHTQDAEGHTALHLAILFKKYDLLKYLLEQDQHQQATYSTDDMPLELYTDNRGKTALHLAVMNNDPQAAAQLASKRACVSQNSRGDTALHLAAQLGHTKICNIILQSGANTQITNHNKRTPLDLALIFMHYEIAKLLQRHHSTITATVNTHESY